MSRNQDGFFETRSFLVALTALELAVWICLPLLPENRD